MAKAQIVALGGGGFSTEESPVLDDYILALAKRDRPRICFVPTASGDNENYIVRFYRRFSQIGCEPTHLELFRRNEENLERFARSQDIIYVGGGNTANLLAIWKLHGFDQALRKALDGGTVLAGISAGSICWFEQGVTDSFGGELTSLEGLGFLRGSNCPHYDGEPSRRPAFQRLVSKGMPAGVAADDGVALHYVDGALYRAVASREEGKAYRVVLEEGTVREETLATEVLA